MKKILFFAAIAAISLASCSNDETIASNSSGEISFRPLMNNATRAADITNQESLESFNVYAFKTGETTPAYFSNVNFADAGSGTYVSVAKYYWPTYNLDFYSWSAHSSNGDRNADVTPSAYNSFTVTVQADADNQADFVYASKTNVAKTDAVTDLTFGHKESRIVLKVKNTAGNIRYDVVGWRIGFAAPSGSTTDGGATWTPAAKAASNVFSATESKTVAASTTTASAFTKAQIMIPQAITPVTAYTGSTAGDPVNGSYIAVKYKAQNTTNNEWIVGSSSEGSEIYGIWPIPAITWAPGKQYTYVIDLAQGGYLDANKDGSNEKLDPIMDSPIQFASVTVSDWDTSTDDINATMP